MGRRTREKQIKFWATEEEYNLIEKKVKKSNLTKQEYMLRSALNKKILVIDGLKDLMLELSKQSNELNKLNLILSRNEEFKTEELNDLKDKLMELWIQIEKTLKEGKETDGSN